MSVYKKLMDARVQLQSAPLKKSGHNKFAGYQYFELGDFMPTINQIFHKIGLCGVVSFEKDLATLTITDTEDGSQLTLKSPMADANLKGCHPIQNLGAVETYTRRYLWVTAMEIVEHDALDSSAPLKEEKKAPVISPRNGIGDDLPQEIKEFLQEFASSITELVKNGKAKEALLMIDEQELEADQKVYLSNQLDSSVRSAIKKAKEI